MVPFAGHELPVQFEGVVAEHRAVRTSAGLFDVSHMGQFFLEGESAEALLQWATPNDVGKLRKGRAHYSSLLSDDGTLIDDLLVYRLGDQRFAVVPNAANIDRDRERLLELVAQRGFEGSVTLDDQSADQALLALQGPKAIDVLERLFETEDGGKRPAKLRSFGFLRKGTVAGRPFTMISRTGYTGEDGVEIMLPNAEAEAVFEALLAEEEVAPIGLGARDTLRLEAGLCLHGNDIDDTVSPIEAGLDWTVKLGKGDFAGSERLRNEKESGPSRRLIGLEVLGRGIARNGHVVRAEPGGAEVGLVTSGTHSPTLEKAIAMALVEAGVAETGRELVVEVRGRELPVRVVDLPFYRRPSAE